MNWTDLVKSRIKELNMTQEKLAEMVGVTPGGMGHWLNKRREPSIEQIAAILKVLNLEETVLHSDGSLGYLDETIENVSKIDIQPQFQKNFPLLSAVQAGQWTEACEPYSLDEIDEWYEATVRTSEQCFWLRVQGDSMTSASGVSIPEWTLVLVDTNREHENGSLVVAKLTDVNEATFKKFVSDGGQHYLKPLNDKYQMIPINGNCKIIGVVVEARLRLV